MKIKMPFSLKAFVLFCVIVLATITSASCRFTYLDADYRYGYIRKDGSFVYPCKLRAGGNFDNSLFSRVVLDMVPPSDLTYKGKLLTRDGQLLPTSNSLYVRDTPSDGLAQCVDSDAADANCDATYMDLSGRPLGKCFSMTTRFGEGIAAVVEKGKVGIINSQGLFVVPPKEEAVLTKEGFSEGMLLAKKGSLYGFLNRECNWIVPPIFLSAQSYKNGFALVQIKSSGANTKNSYGFIDRTGRLLPVRFERCDENLASGVAVVGIQRSRSDSAKLSWGLYSSEGKWIIQPQSEFIGTLQDGLRLIRKNGLFGYIDNFGKVIIPARYLDAEDFSEGLAAVRCSTKDTIAFIDKKGKIVIKLAPKLSYRLGCYKMKFSEGLCRCEGVNEKTGLRAYGYLNNSGQWQIKPQFVSASAFSQGIAKVAVSLKHNSSCSR